VKCWRVVQVSGQTNSALHLEEGLNDRLVKAVACTALRHFEAGETCQFDWSMRSYCLLCHLGGESRTYRAVSPDQVQDKRRRMLQVKSTS
jgi:hypothetical protein